MTEPAHHRPLPDFLKHGDRALGFPHPRHPGTAAIGKGFPERGAPPKGSRHDPQNADAELAREWLEHVAAGRIGGCATNDK